MPKRRREVPSSRFLNEAPVMRSVLRRSERQDANVLVEETRLNQVPTRLGLIELPALFRKMLYFIDGTRRFGIPGLASSLS